MTDFRTAAQQALEALEPMQNDRDDTAIQRAITALRAALEQPEQEPVAWMDPNRGEVCRAHWLESHAPERDVDRFSCPLYTHPPRREWRGLTDEQLLYVYNELPNWGMDMDSLSPKLKQFARAIEAALKERNV